MAYMLDSGVLIRYVQPRDPDFPVVRTAVRTLKARGDFLVFVSQNAVEYWGVSTRPATARGGYGLTPIQASGRLQLMERTFARVADSDAVYPEWRRLVLSRAVSGVQVHDARLVAAMNVHGISNILTFNVTDFTRYPGITAVHPNSV